MKKIISFLTFVFVVALTISAYAEEVKLDISKPEAIKTALQAFSGKSVTISTENNDSITGIVEEVGADVVKLKELSGKEFYSAIIKLNSINSVVYRSK